ncbi:MAG: D-hexose-6-phosphate mutarotase [Chthoniobacteraceae bacterium]|nr:D-hexose-6-phosphate mutarotase [Chthoniobacteraceae bacterium]
MDTSLELPGVARLMTGPGGLPRYEITTPLAQAQIFLHGAHVARFTPAGQAPLLFLSEKSWFDPAKPIRGGVPVIFPWFGPRQGHPDAPAHGFARLRSWTPESLVQEPDGAVVLTLRLEPDDASRALWGEPADWVLRHRITVAATLTMELEIENRGNAPLRCEEALHTYFHVGDVRQIAVHGLEGAEYYDKADGMRRKRQDGEPIRFTAETDRTYIDTAGACVIDDPALRRRILVEKENSSSTIVWNPWIAKARSMPDFGDDEWPGMVCVETGNVADNALEIAPGARHLTRTVLRTEPR